LRIRARVSARSSMVSSSTSLKVVLAVMRLIECGIYEESGLLFQVLDVASHLPSCRVELSFPIDLATNDFFSIAWAKVGRYSI
jgi:hypothetical protein